MYADKAINHRHVTAYHIILYNGVDICHIYMCYPDDENHSDENIGHSMDEDSVDVD